MNNKNQNISCDLAIEAHEMLSCAFDEASNEGITYNFYKEKNENKEITVTRVTVDTEIGSRNLGKPIGRYVTIEMPSGFNDSQTLYEKMCKKCAEEISELLKTIDMGKRDTILVIGLGNRHITADSLGPKVIGEIMVTRHLVKYIPKEIDERIRPVCAIAPGVLGTTGMETEEIVRSLTKEIEPTLVIVIDSLCSGKVERVNTTIQITDTGITPGGGVGNKRKTINKETLGVPVLAIGVPTVVDASTIAIEGINIACGYDNVIDEQSDKLRKKLKAEFKNLIVAPKDIDSKTDDIASVIANGINISLHDGITLNDIDRYV